MDSGSTDVKGKQKKKRHRSLSFNSGSRTSMPAEIKRHSFRVSQGKRKCQESREKLAQFVFVDMSLLSDVT